MLDSFGRHWIEKPVKGITSVLVKTGVRPDHLTILAGVAGGFSAWLVSQGFLYAAVSVLWISGGLDVLDGALARAKSSSSQSGALLDMIVDRMVEAFFLVGVAVLDSRMVWPVMGFLISVIFNFSTFLAAGALIANSGKKSMHYDPGLMERTETFIVLTATALCVPFRVPILWGSVLLIVFTGIRRFIRVYKYLGPEKQG